MKLKTTDLIVNEDGSIYHLHLKPEQIAETIITVGDQDRVADVSQHFDVIEYKAAHREFVTHTGVMNNKRITVISTGIGTDNIDIVLNELDALTNIDFVTKAPKAEIKSLDIIRIGTSGCVQADIPINSILFSEYAIGLEGLLNHYAFENTIQETNLRDAFVSQVPLKNIYPYCFAAGESLIKKFEPHFRKGLTITAEGFYAPQGRVLRYTNNNPDFIKQLNAFKHPHHRVTNLEMETAGIYGLGKVLGHSCISINAILANRITDEFSADPKKIVDDMIVQVLDILTK
jgi:uridine phosphorylase